MKTTKKKSESLTGNKQNQGTSFLRTFLPILITLCLTFFISLTVSAHCDSYDGPVIKDAQKALETNNVKLVLKWISKEQETEIVSLFNKTYNLKKGDKEIYEIVEKHLFETLVRLHRETEGAPYTGLKPAGTTKKIILMSDNAIATGDFDDLITKLDTHIGNVLHEKYEKVAQLNKVKDESVEKGREYVQSYIDYTHTIEAIHDIIDSGSDGKSVHKH